MVEYVTLVYTDFAIDKQNKDFFEKSIHKVNFCSKSSGYLCTCMPKLVEC